jgi:hypothetical protein
MIEQWVAEWEAEHGPLRARPRGDTLEDNRREEACSLTDTLCIAWRGARWHASTRRLCAQRPARYMVARATWQDGDFGFERPFSACDREGP